MTPGFPAPLGRYRLVDKIASGGMAEIFRAKLIGVEGFEKTVVIKRIHPFWSERREFITMLVDEAKLLVYLNHPNIVQVIELGRDGNIHFIVMEYVEGVDLRRLLQRLKELKRPLPPRFAVGIMVEVLKGLYYAHEKSLPERGKLGIVHRDVSPQNILLSFDGEVKVTDFGIAKAMTQSHETQTGVLKGKYAYMSPEQAVGAALDARSDLFSCGIVLYEMLFDRRLFAGASDIETLDRVRRAEVFWPEDLSTALHPGIIEALKKALARRPQDRFASAEEFAEALEACVPAAERFSQRKFCRFLSEVFSAEIQKRRQVREEKQENFSRQTRIVPGREGTVSLRPLAATEVEARPHPMTEARAEAPKVSRRLWLYPLVAAALIVPFYWFSAQRKVPSQAWTALPPLFSEAFSAAAALRPLLPATQPVEKAPAVLPKNDLRLAVLPAQGHLSAVFPGGKREGVGELWLRDLPVGTEVRVSASLANYEPVQRSFTVAEQASPQESLIQLEKKAPAYGSIRVNAVPWGKVSIPGYVSGGETPLVRGRIPEGKYSVSVSHPPLHKTLSASALVRAGKTTRCRADFEGRGTISCR